MSGIIINPYVYGAGVDEAYSFEYEIDAGLPDVTLFGQNGLVFNYDIDWGDGTSDSGVVVNDQTHTYLVGPGGSGPVGGLYTVRITGVFPGLEMGRGATADRIQIKRFLNWGINPLGGLSKAFYYCTNMTYEATDVPDLSALVTKGFYYTFYYCTAITELDLSDWDVSNVESFQGIFGRCTNLTLLNVNDWDLSSATQLALGFEYVGSAGAGCALSADNWAPGVQIHNAFQYAKFSSISLANWDMTGITSLSYTFRACDGQIVLDLSSWTNTSHITDLTYAFQGGEWTDINLTGWDTSNTTSWSLAFYGLYYLENIIGLNGLNGDSLTGTGLATCFRFSYKLTFDTHNFNDTFGSNWSITSLSDTFKHVSITGPGTAAPNVTNWDVSNVTTFTNCFEQTDIISGTLEIEGWDVSLATNFQNLFYKTNAALPTPLDLTSWNFTSAVTNMQTMFRSTNATDVEFSSSADFSGVTTMSFMFYGITVTNIDFPTNADFSSLANGGNMLYYLSNMGTANYNNFLIRMDATNTATPGTLTMAASTYSALPHAAATAKANLEAAGWTITDGGPV